MWEPPSSAEWPCDGCGRRFHAVQRRGECPGCGRRHESVSCPECGGWAPPLDWYWVPRCPSCSWLHLGTHRWECAECREATDPFEHEGICGRCGTPVALICPECGARNSHGAWIDHVAGEEYEPPPPVDPWDAIGGSPLWQPPPIDGALPEKRVHWLLLRAAWLVERCGVARASAVPLPDWERTPEMCRELLARLARGAGLDPGPIDLEFFDDRGGGAGLHIPEFREDGRYGIVVGRDDLDRPERLLATLCHEIAHNWLHRRLAFDHSTLDAEALTDLVTVHLGWGPWRAAGAPEWEFVLAHDPDRRAYLAAEDFGLALALYSRLRDEPAAPMEALPSVARSLGGRMLEYLDAHADIVPTLRERPSSMLQGVEWRQAGASEEAP